MMYCRHLELKDFRNLREVELGFQPGTTLLMGPNGQGKSNFLEAILALSTGRGRSTRSLANLIYSGHGDRSPFARVRSSIAGQNGETRLELVFSAVDGQVSEDGSSRGRTARRASVDGNPTSLSKFMGKLKAVHFSPEDLDLLNGPPSLRRRFLDISASQADAVYLRNLMQYNHVVAQRNSLLREIKTTGHETLEPLKFWDLKLSELAEPIVNSRTKFVRHLSGHATETFHRLSSGAPKLELKYAVALPGRIESMLTVEALEKLRAREIGAGQSLFGPHRDDLVITLGGRPVEGFGSRGEHRLIVLSLRFAQLQWLCDVTGELPILLLDDIFSELDSYHRKMVADGIPDGAQVFITAAEVSGVPEHLARSAHVLTVDSGVVQWKRIDATSP